MDIRSKIKSTLNSQMGKLTHITKSSDTSKLQGMISEKKVVVSKKDVYEMLEEVTMIESELEEIRLNPFGSNIKDIESASKDFIKVLNKKLPKLRVKDLERLTKLFSRVESEIRNAKNMANTDSLKSEKEQILSKVNKELTEMMGAASAGSFVGPLFTSPIKRTMPVKTSNKKSYDVKEGKGFSPWLVDKDNPKGETNGLTPDMLTKILTKIAKMHDEDEKFTQDSDDENYYEQNISEKWSETYKKSIDCDNPKGFSQKAHCQGKIKKQDTQEATLSSSSGSYETPFFLAKDSKNWRGAAKTLFKGGKFVRVKDKCKTFPYCNQGDIKALELFEDGKYSMLADKVANKMGEDPLKVKSIVLNSIEESLFQERMKQINSKKVENSEKNNKLSKK